MQINKWQWKRGPAF